MSPIDNPATMTPSPHPNLHVLAALLVAAVGVRAAGAETLLRAEWTDRHATSALVPTTPDHPGHVDVDADGTGFYRLDRVDDRASGIGATLDVSQRQNQWLRIGYAIRGQNAHGLAGLGYRIRSADAKTVLGMNVDYPPCPKQPDSWTSCTLYAYVANGADTMDVFLTAPFSSQLDVRSVEVDTVAPESTQPLSATAAADMDRLFDWIRTRYFVADRVDWAQARDRCDAGTFPAGFDPLVPFARCLLRQLPENAHSYISRKPAARPPVPVNAVKQLESGTGYAKLAPAAVEPGAESDAYANATRRAIAALQAQGVSTWIIDLRGNGGGSVYPMLAAVAPLLGPQRKPLVYWERADGSRIPVRLTARGAEEGDTLQVAIDGLKPPRPRTRIVVFIDKGCLSSCEILATMLSSRKNVQLLGQPTGGLNTSNDEYPLPAPYQFMLTTAYVMDASGRRRYPNVVPAVSHAGDEASWFAAAESLLAR